MWMIDDKHDGREIELDFVDSFDRLLAAYQEDFDRLKTDETDQLNAEAIENARRPVEKNPA